MDVVVESAEHAPNPQFTEAAKLYLKKVVELRQAFDAYQMLQFDIDQAWRQLPEKTKEWLAHLDHHQYRALKEAAFANE